MREQMQMGWSAKGSDRGQFLVTEQHQRWWTVRIVSRIGRVSMHGVFGCWNSLGRLDFSQKGLYRATCLLKCTSHVLGVLAEV